MISRTERLNRTALLRTPEEMEALAAAHVMLLGLGGVGSYAAEALCRAGIGEMTLVDNDTVAPSNLNRQLPALVSTIGQRKTDVVAQRMKDIAPDMALHCVNAFYLPENPVRIPENCTLVIDAIDTVSAKIDLAVRCNQREIPLISCMGMGNRLDPAQIRLGDLFQTTNCPLCRVMRRELRKRGIEHLDVVFSPEEPVCATQLEAPPPGRRSVPASSPWVPATAGLLLGSQVVRNLISKRKGV